MTVAPEPVAVPRVTQPHPSRGVIHDVWVIARRGLIHMKRQPEALSDATIQPLMFVLLFAFVFGGAIEVSALTRFVELLTYAATALAILGGTALLERDGKASLTGLVTSAVALVLTWGVIVAIVKTVSLIVRHWLGI